MNFVYLRLFNAISVGSSILSATVSKHSCGTLYIWSLERDQNRELTPNLFYYLYFRDKAKARLDSANRRTAWASHLRSPFWFFRKPIWDPFPFRTSEGTTGPDNGEHITVPQRVCGFLGQGKWGVFAAFLTPLKGFLKVLVMVEMLTREHCS